MPKRGLQYKGSPPQNKTVFLGGESFPKSVYPLTHPRVFVRFGKTKGEIWIENGDFRGDLGGVLRGLDLVWESATPPTHIWEKSPPPKKKKLGLPLSSFISRTAFPLMRPRDSR